ncbi:MAG: hypothetical protein KGJ13_10655, partial [Patescibacteria group bacterium]|nr:hypothetical protein [Patescibacteria group bacterium]
MSFAFSQSNPFEIEFTPGMARFYSATGPIFTSDVVPLTSISAANPAVVTVPAVPSTWANGDEIQLNLNPPFSADVLTGRRFIIGSVTTTTFTIFDSLTGAGIDGSTFTYTPNATGTQDSVLKVLEIAVPYGPNDFDQIRIVQNDSVALILCVGYAPLSLTTTSTGFSIVTQTFTDGPYLDINTTTTTLTPSGTTGSITLTASATTGINSGSGFLATDIGRLVRIQGAPAAWAAGTAYVKSATVLGSDNNIYIAQVKSTGVDPTSDNGANWVLSGQVVVWTWATITAVASATSITATINGPALTTTAATVSWQLGLYSQTTGYPAVGVYHEGRFWLAGSTTVFNRIDGSNSNQVFNFAPTASDGTVGDGNAVSIVSNADTRNKIVWMLTAQEGILVGTISGEWLIRGSQFGDPLTPTSVQIRRVSTYGCAAIEPQIASLTTVFVQKQQRELLDFDHYPYGETAGWSANDISLLANHLTASGVAEIRLQQEPNRIMWVRNNDGTL